MNPRTRLAVLAVTFPVFAFAVVGGYLGRTAANEGTYRHLRVFEDVASLISSNYVEDVDSHRVMRGALRGLAEGLDPDSAYLSPDEVRQLDRGAPKPAGETGIELTRQFYLRVVAVRELSPAARAGLMTGDFVRIIDTKPTREMSIIEGAKLLRGEPGSTVKLTVIRGNAAEPHQVELTREAATWPEVSSKIVRPGTGYVRLAAFGPQAPARLREALRALATAGVTRLVLDVRNSATGAPESGLDAARPFVASGTLGIRAGRRVPRQVIGVQAGDGTEARPVVVLIDAGTAGAAELFAAALSGNKRAALVGERTLGRAAVQTLVKLPDGGGLWLSNAWFLTPAGDVIHEKGLEPDLVVESPDVEFGAPRPAADPILEKALERLSTTAPPPVTVR